MQYGNLDGHIELFAHWTLVLLNRWIGCNFISVWWKQLITRIKASQLSTAVYYFPTCFDFVFLCYEYSILILDTALFHSARLLPRYTYYSCCIYSCLFWQGLRMFKLNYVSCFALLFKIVFYSSFIHFLTKKAFSASI